MKGDLLHALDAQRIFEVGGEEWLIGHSLDDARL